MNSNAISELKARYLDLIVHHHLVKSRLRRIERRREAPPATLQQMGNRKRPFGRALIQELHSSLMRRVKRLLSNPHMLNVALVVSSAFEFSDDLHDDEGDECTDDHDDKDVDMPYYIAHQRLNLINKPEARPNLKHLSLPP